MTEDEGFPRLEAWMTCSEAADVLGVSRQTVNRMVLTKVFESTHLLGEKPIYVLSSDEVNSVKNSHTFRKVNGSKPPVLVDEIQNWPPVAAPEPEPVPSLEDVLSPSVPFSDAI